MKTLTEQQINIAIAEAVGWTKIDWYEDNAGPGFWHGIPPVKLDANWEVVTQESKNLPNFCGDLNAMAQAEATLTDEKRIEFVECLCDIVFTRSINGWYDMTANEVGKMLAATALQRATAFVRALKLEPKSK